MRVRPNLIHLPFAGKKPWGKVVKRITVNDISCYWNPRNVRFWECYLMQTKIYLFNTSCKEITNDKIILPNEVDDKNNEGDDSLVENLLDRKSLSDDLECSFSLYKKFNVRVRSDSFFKLNTQDKFFKVATKTFMDFDKPIFCREIHVDSKKNIKNNKVSIAIVNSKLSESQLIKGMRGLPMLDDSRQKCLESILKQASESNADMLVMPEC